MRGERALVLTLFFLSGVCALIYEVVWARELSLILGVTVFSTATVLAAYMAGLALGSFAFARVIDRSRNPVRVYALLEVGIGLCALLIPLGFDAVRALFAATGDLLADRFLVLSVFRSLVALLVLLVPTFFMGGTVPAIGRYLVERKESVGWNVGLLYALNTLGGAVGVALTGFVLIPSLGLAQTTAWAVAGNFAIAAILLLARIGDATERIEAQAEPVPLPPERARLVWLAATVFALSGFAALAYEVIWTRVLILHVHNTSYAFSIMLSVFLGGLVLGDGLMIRFYDRVARPVFWLGVVQVSIGISVVVAALAYEPLARLSQEILGSDRIDSWGASVAVMFVRAALVMLPFTVLLGMTFPLVARIVCQDVGEAGRALGNVYAANTCGSILGSLAAAFVLIPLLGLRGSLLLLSALNVALGAFCWVADVQGAAVRTALAVAVLACLVLPHLAIPPDLFYDAYDRPLTKLVYYREGVTDTTGVWESLRSGHRGVFYGDGRGTAGTMTNSLNRTQGHLAHLLHPAPKLSLQIGFGVGNTLAAASLHPDVERLDCAELSPHVRETASYFWTNEGVLDDPKVRLIIDDGRNYLLRARDRYDVITLEPPNVFTAGVVNLYTREFYELAHGALADGGLLSQWIAAVDHTDEDVMRMVRAITEVFPSVTLWNMGPLDDFGFEAPTGFLLVMASKHPLSIDPRAMDRRIAFPAIREDLEAVGLPNAAGLLSLFIAGDAGLRRWTAEVAPVTDDRTVVDYSSARSVHSGYGLGFATLRGPQQLEWLQRLTGVARLVLELREPVAQLLDASVRDPELTREIAAHHGRFNEKLELWQLGLAERAVSP